MAKLVHEALRINGAPRLNLAGAADGERGDEVLTPDALGFVAQLQRDFGARRDELDFPDFLTLSAARLVD